MWCGSTYPTLVNNTKSTVLVTERQIVSICPTNEAVTALLAAYYCFNIEYPSGSLLFFTALEILLLEIAPRGQNDCCFEMGRGWPGL